jgi:hypothetical protein
MNATWIRISRAEFNVGGKSGLCIVEGMDDTGNILSRVVSNQTDIVANELTRLASLGAKNVLAGPPLSKLADIWVPDETDETDEKPTDEKPTDDGRKPDETETDDHKGPGTGRKYHKPPTEWTRSPKFSSRNGQRIDTIVLHYTFSRTTESAVTTLTTGKRVASAHYVIGRDGKCIQLVKDSDKAWHAPNVNSRSIGIEHVAMPGDRLSPEQEKTTVELCKYLMEEYHIPLSGITGHKYTGQNTSCPANLFGPKSTLEELKAWAKKHLGDI